MAEKHFTEVRIDRANRDGLIFWAQEVAGGVVVKSEGFRRPQDAAFMAQGWADAYGAVFEQRTYAD